MTNRIISTEYSDEMKKSYIDYSMSVITDRAVPDIRDGLKPVQRRIIYDMDTLHVNHDKKELKSARIVGDTMGKYHAHGDCLRGNTLVYTLYGEYKTIKEIYEEPDRAFDTLAFDTKKHQTRYVRAHDVRIGQYTDTVYHIVLENGEELEVTANHPILLANFEWIKAENIKAGNLLFVRAFGKQDIPYIIDDKKIQTYETKVVDVYTENVDAEPMYDFTVDTYHNILIPIAQDNKTVQFLSVHNSSIYEALVTMSQGFKKSMPLIDGKGNFGSIEGDGAAASRYTEAKLQKFTDDVMLKDIETTVPFKANYSNDDIEPEVLPALIPNFLLNGAEGIAVGMATSVPTHNLSELCDLCSAYVDNHNLSYDKMLSILPGPDFPTGGIVANADELPDIYKTGNGKLRIRGKLEYKHGKGKEKDRLVVTEIPYTMIGNGIPKFMSDVISLIENKTLPEITDVGNASSDKGIYIFMDLKKDADIERIKNVLYSKTKLEDTFGVSMLAIHNKTPHVMNLQEILQAWYEFQHEILINKYRNLLQKEKEKKEIQEGLIAAYDMLDLIIAVIRGSKQRKNAETALTTGNLQDVSIEKKYQAKAKKLHFTERQAKAILEMPLYRLIGLEINQLKKTFETTVQNIADYEKILGEKKDRDKLIKKSLKNIKDLYGTARKTQLRNCEEVTEIKENIPDGYFVLDNDGYCKLIDENIYKKNEDVILSEAMFVTELKDNNSVFVFTDQGNCLQIRKERIPLKKVKEKGVAVNNISKLELHEKILHITNSQDVEKEVLIFLTENGLIKKTEGNEFVTRNQKIAATKLDANDLVKEIVLDNKTVELDGQKIKGDIVPLLKRNSKGVIFKNLLKRKR